MNKIILSEDFEVSCIVHGHWRLTEWNMSDRQLIEFIEQTIDFEVTTFDHADIYGNYEC